MRKYFVCSAVIAMVIVLSSVSAFSQTDQAPAKEDQAQVQGTQAAPAQASQTLATPTPQAVPAEAAKTNELSIYGEVQAVNVQAGSMTVQYYDYDNDEEKTLEVAVDKDSKLENVKAVAEIKKGDWADVTYTANGGKNMAKLVSVEKEEPAAEDNAPVGMTDE